MDADTMLEAGWPAHYAEYPATFDQLTRAAAQEPGWYCYGNQSPTGGPASPRCVADTLDLLIAAARAGLPAPWIFPVPDGRGRLEVDWDGRQAVNGICAVEWSHAGRWKVWITRMHDVPLRGVRGTVELVKLEVSRWSFVL